MPSRERVLKIVLAGDPKGAVKAFTETDTAASGLGAKFDKLKSSPVAFAAVTTTAVAAVGKVLYDVGASFDDAYDKIRVNTGATGDTLEALKNDFRAVVQEVPASFEDASTAISTVNARLGLTGKPLQTVSEQFLELSRITKTDVAGNIDAATAALNNWQIPAAQQPMVLDHLFRASQLTGVSFADLASGMSTTGTQMRALGFEFDDSIALVGALGKAGIDASDVLPALSKAMAGAAKDGKSAGDVFQETFDAISAAPDDVSAASVALDVFGAKAGPKFAEMIREGKFDYVDLMKQIQGGSDTILGAGKDTQDFAEKFEMFKNRALVAIEPIATRVFEILGQGMDFLSQHQPVLVALAVVIGGALVLAFTAWAISAATAAIATIAAAAPVIAIGLAIAAVIAAIVLLVENWDIVSAKIVEVWDMIVAKVQEAVGFLIGLIESYIGFYISMPGRIRDALAGLAGVFIDAFKGAFNAVVGLWNSLDFGIHLDFSIPDWVPGVGGQGFHLGINDVIPDVPMLAGGGITTVPTLAVVGDNPSGREAIVPLERAGEMGFGGGGDQIHFHNHGVIGSQSELERWVLASIESLGNGGRKLGPGGRRLLSST